MRNDINKLKFTLTKEMAYMMIQINNLNKEKDLLESQLKIYKNSIHYHELNNSKKKLERKINRIKKQFINEFQKENKIEIEKYWKIRSMK